MTEEDSRPERPRIKAIGPTGWLTVFGPRSPCCPRGRIRVIYANDSGAKSSRNRHRRPRTSEQKAASKTRSCVGGGTVRWPPGGASKTPGGKPTARMAAVLAIVISLGSPGERENPRSNAHRSSPSQATTTQFERGAVPDVPEDQISRPPGLLGTSASVLKRNDRLPRKFPVPARLFGKLSRRFSLVQGRL